ncbi:exosome complex component RRP46-like [Physella acuta]|uniref:exosome complex component RRP46-like n=1 Tax=Physella acuta TaxID=109671 RepID=UPI0027DDD7E1|nr:exosome complex component RRP46-like [Physella acuta]
MAAAFRIVKKEDLEAEEQKEPNHTLRCLTSEFGCLTRQDGSVSLSQGDTTAIAVTYGPAEVRMVRELIDRATVELIYKPKVGMTSPADRKYETVLKNALDAAIMTSLHPRSSITVIIQETENTGSYLACCINAACMALLDAAVSLKFLLAGVAVAVSQSGQLQLDPTLQQEQEARANLTFVFESVDLKIVTVVTTGKFTHEEYKQGLELSRLAAVNVFTFFRESVSRKLLHLCK